MSSAPVLRGGQPEATVLAPGGVSYIGALFLISATILTTALFTETARFADYDTYTYYIDGLVHFPSWDWLKLEPLSNFYLLACYWLTLDVIATNNLAHDLLLVSFPILLWASFRPTTTPWPALLAVFALFGPLLTFVTLRATPAYLLATWAVFDASVQRRRAFPLIVLAIGFHFSAVMVVPPLLILFFREKLPNWLRFERPGMLLLIGTLTVAAVFLVASAVAGAAVDFINNIPFLAKYVVYSSTANENLDTSLNHYIFLGIATFMLLIFLFSARGEMVRLNVYLLSSYLVYLALFLAASPVAAFRQTPFWILPLIGTLPWARLLKPGFASFVFVLACEATFLAQINGVYT